MEEAELEDSITALVNWGLEKQRNREEGSIIFYPTVISFIILVLLSSYNLYTMTTSYLSRPESDDESEVETDDDDTSEEENE